MHFLDFRSVLTDMFAEELAPFGPVAGIEFIHRNHTDVYRIRGHRGNLIVHASADGKAYLKRLRANLELLAPLEDPRIPKPLAWRSSSAAPRNHEWAVLVYEEKLGEKISRHHFPSGAWEGIAECLARVHALEGDDVPVSGPVFNGHDAAHFDAFARTLLLRMGDLPMRSSRISAHLEQMMAFLDEHQAAFGVPARVIHGDLDRKNILASGSQVSLLDWADLANGDYAFDLGMLKFMLDSVAPASSARLIRDQARRYRTRFADDSLELRLRFFLALAGLVHAFQACDDTGAFKPARAWRVRTSYLHSEAQWRSPLQLDGERAGAPAVRTEQWALDIDQPMRGLYYLLAPKRVV
ncbi:MAG: aminoglycoside phosphotransferase family protein [Candidatus Dormibacter sp.]